MALQRRRPPRRKLKLASRKSERQIKEERQAYRIFGGVVAAIAALVLFGVFTRARDIDETTGCPKDDAIPRAHTLVLIDQTDALNPRQITYVKQVILTEYSNLARYQKLTVRGVSADPDAASREIVRCRVLKRSEVAGVGVNEDMVDEQFKKIVGTPMAEYLDGLSNVPTSTWSPLMESFQAASTAVDFGPSVKTRRLVVVSDLAQNSKGFTQYGRGRDHGPSPEQAMRPYLAQLDGAVVRVHYVLRPKLSRIQGPEHRAFWTRYFTASGSRDVKIGWGIQLANRK